jgi:hypothetical protein
MVASTNTLAATVSPASLSFTTANWMIYQDVTVTGIEDANTADDTSTAILSGTGLANVNVALTVVDNDTQAIIASTGSVMLAENGNTTFGVHLGAMPPGNVTVTVVSGDPGAATVSGSLTFTTANYGIDQLVTVTGVQDPDLVGEAVVITLSSSGLVDRLVTANVTDDDTQKVLVSQPTLTIGEGTTGNFTVSLAFQPAATVIVNLGSTNPAVATASPAMLTFTTANYSIPQGVNVISLQDPDPVNGATTITASAPEAVSGSVEVTVIDDDLLEIEVDQTLMWVYEGQVGGFMVRLTAQPAANVVVMIATTDPFRANPSPKNVTFTTSNWNLYQSVNVVSGDDLDVDHHGVRLDLMSSGMITRSVRVDVIDDDLLAVEPVYFDICHGETVDARVSLLGPPFPGPPHDGRLDVSLQPGIYVSVDPPVLSFDLGNFSVGQFITLSSLPAGFAALDTVVLSSPGQRDVQIDFNLRSCGPIEPM